MKDRFWIGVLLIIAVCAVAANSPRWVTMSQCGQMMHDTLKTVCFTGSYSSLTGVPTNISTFTNNVPYLTAASIPVTYYNNSTTTSGVATFYLTNDKTSGGTALYTTLDYVDLAVNSTNGLYTYSWSLAGDNKTLTITVKYSTNTGVLGLLGIALTNATVNVPNGTVVYVKIDGH